MAGKSWLQVYSCVAMMFVSIFGATLTPYAFIWQASEESEDVVVLFVQHKTDTECCIPKF